jgi:hypothetical protein
MKFPGATDLDTYLQFWSIPVIVIAQTRGIGATYSKLISDLVHILMARNNPRASTMFSPYSECCRVFNQCAFFYGLLEWNGIPTMDDASRIAIV